MSRAPTVGVGHLGIKIVDSHQMTPPGGRQVVWRNVVKIGFGGIGWQPFAHVPGLILSPWPFLCFGPALTDRRWHRGLHDRWAHTVVIDVRQESLRFDSST